MTRLGQIPVGQASRYRLLAVLRELALYERERIADSQVTYVLALRPLATAYDVPPSLLTEFATLSEAQAWLQCWARHPPRQHQGLHHSTGPEQGEFPFGPYLGRKPREAKATAPTTRQHETITD
jgi:hypothetical protein